MAKFKAGDTITNGDSFFTIDYIASQGKAYKMVGADTWMPVAIVDRYWTIADNEPTIEE